MDYSTTDDPFSDMDTDEDSTSSENETEIYDQSEWYNADFIKKGKQNNKIIIHYDTDLNGHRLRFIIYQDRPPGFQSFGRFDFADGSHGESICPILMEKLENQNPVITKCGHIFSLKGIVLAARMRSFKCPLCQQDIKINDV